MKGKGRASTGLPHAVGAITVQGGKRVAPKDKASGEICSQSSPITPLHATAEVAIRLTMSPSVWPQGTEISQGFH